MRLPKLTDDLNGQSSNVIKKLQQINAAAVSDQYQQQQSNVPQQQLPTVSSSPYYSANYPTQRMYI